MWENVIKKENPVKRNKGKFNSTIHPEPKPDFDSSHLENPNNFTNFFFILLHHSPVPSVILDILKPSPDTGTAWDNDMWTRENIVCMLARVTGVDLCSNTNFIYDKTIKVEFFPEHKFIGNLPRNSHRFARIGFLARISFSNTLTLST